MEVLSHRPTGIDFVLLALFVQLGIRSSGCSGSQINFGIKSYL